MEVVSQPLGLRLVGAGAIVFLGLLFFFKSASPFDSTAVRIGGLLVAVIAAVRTFRLGIRANQSEIVVRNFFRTHRLRWEDVRQIGIGAGWMGRRTTNLILVAKNGSVVPATATTNRLREQIRVMQGLSELRPDLPIRYFEAT